MKTTEDRRSIPIADIECAANRSVTGIDELAANIGAVGLINPISLAPIEGAAAPPHWRVAAGRRRFTAIMKLGWTELTPENWRPLPARADDVIVAFSENFHRENLTLAEEVAQLRECQAARKLTHAELGAILGKSESWVALRTRLFALSGGWETVLAEPERYPGWSARHLEFVARLPDEVQTRLFKSYRGPRENSPAPTFADFAKCVANDTAYEIDTAKPFLAKCAKCEKRSDRDGVLFPEFAAGVPRCLDAQCFNRKLEKYLDTEVAKIKREKNSVTLLLSGRFAGYDTFAYRHQNAALREGDYTVDKKAGEPNALFLDGPRAGEYVNVKVKKNRSGMVSGGGAASPDKPVKTLREREREFTGKRMRRAVNLLIEYLKRDSLFDEVCAHYGNPQSAPSDFSRMIDRLVLALGYSSDYYSHLQRLGTREKKFPELYDKIHYSALFNYAVRQLVGELQQDAGQTLSDITDDWARDICDRLRLNWRRDYLERAAAEIPEPKSLISARREKSRKKPDTTAAGN